MLRRERLVTVATFGTSLEASLARGALEASGIRALVSDEGLGTFSLRRGGLHGADVQVFASDQDRALVALRRMSLHTVLPRAAEADRQTRGSTGGRPWVATVKVMLALLLAFFILGLVFNARSRAGQLPFNAPRPSSGR
jgi:hypothetical protein